MEMPEAAESELLDRCTALMSRKEINKHFHILPERKIVYVSVPKVASPTLKTIFARLAVGSAEYVPANAHNSKALPFGSPKEFGLRRLLRQIDNSKWRCVSFVRSPYSRFLSAYLDKFVRKSPEERRETQAKFAIELGFTPGEQVTFAEFVQAVSRQSAPAMNGIGALRPICFCFLM